MAKGVPDKRYTAEFKKHVIKTMREEGLCSRFSICPFTTRIGSAVIERIKHSRS